MFMKMMCLNSVNLKSWFQILQSLHARLFQIMCILLRWLFSAEPSHTGHDDQRDISYSDAKILSSTLLPLNPVEMTVAPVVPVASEVAVDPEVHKEDMICTVNTEDSDIPCNDDIMFPTAIEKEDPAQPFRNEKSPNPASRDCKVAHDKNDPAAASQCSLADATPNSITKGLLNEEEINVPVDCEESEEDSYDDVDDDDEDADIPYFSDIEMMILEMDLCPADEESNITRRVSKYQHEDAKRKIIRLEQCAQSSMQRALASKGTLAVLYDHHVKHYIKKTEVIIGRTTEDNQVDIDLGDNKVSRRQALIKMDADGSFSLKNLGKNSIFLNGREIATGELLRFASSNLIEIREMALGPLEINYKSVRAVSGKNCDQKTLEIPNRNLLSGNWVASESKTYWGDTQVLKQLKNGLDPNSVSQGSCISSWDFSLDPCDSLFSDRFTCGFRCDLVDDSGVSRVTEIGIDQAGYSVSRLFLDNNHLDGSIPPSLNNLVSLNRLEIQANRLGGEFPKLDSQQPLLLRRQQQRNHPVKFRPPIPSLVDSISNADNSLVGTVPRKPLQQLGSLQVLDLQSQPTR
ncbi:hypothetical protein M0R45_004063 [Rubus argutus]|uniref:FHA domain-containing protein n=1 Tax=Rubus argutus TaxID=59490 RepID=A0AAW1YI68_RUBAR